MMNLEEKEFEDMEWILAMLENVVKYAEDTGRSTIETGNLRSILNLEEKDDRCTCSGCGGDGYRPGVRIKVRKVE